MRTLPELERRKPAPILEGPREVGQAVEAALLADCVDRKIEPAQQAFRVFDPDLNQVVAKTHAHFGSEQIREIARGKVDRLGHLVPVDVLVKMCKHVAAVLYGVGARLDEMPELLFKLRGVDHEELIDADAEAAVSAATSKGKSKRLDANDLSDVFGIDIAASDGDSPLPKAPRKK